MQLPALPGLPLLGCDSFMVLAVFCTVFALVFDLMKRRKWENYPPGPRGFPFVGNLLQVDLRNPHLSFGKLWKKYGNVVSLDFGWTNMVVLSGYNTLKEALVKKSEDFADRPDLPVFQNVLERFGSGIVFAKYGQWWREQRKFSLTMLRRFGMGKKSLELQIVEEAECLMKMFEEEKGLPFDPRFLINSAVSNIICLIVFGYRFEYQDEKSVELLHTIKESFQLEGGFWGQLLNVLPFISHFPGPHHKIFKNQIKIVHFLQEVVAEHKVSLNEHEPRDFIDAFLAEQKKRKDDPTTSFLESGIINTVLDLFSAGTETSSTTLCWALLFMVLYPDVQSQVHEEIDRVIGKEGKPKLEDREEMPFTNAVIHESQRLRNIAPISLPHQTYRDTTIMGYTIPKGTAIIPNLTSALFDEDIWMTPHEFNPGHFLNSDGNFVKPEAFIPFSAGLLTVYDQQKTTASLGLMVEVG
ncbi:cytochrome P450 2D15-like isoform X2 [Narcine bancroftii]|uniref:cytochrome P450 2D15-like isoform X2 n=1 Tax=Narcine bancroftii TaxID=1343680 RepID=UPI003831B3D6